MHATNLRRPELCGFYCGVCDLVRVTLEVFDLISFALLLRTAYKVKGTTSYEYRPGMILRHRLTSKLLPLQLFMAMPTYSLLKHFTG